MLQRAYTLAAGSARALAAPGLLASHRPLQRLLSVSVRDADSQPLIFSSLSKGGYQWLILLWIK